MQQIADLFGVPRSRVYGHLHRPTGDAAAMTDGKAKFGPVGRVAP